MWGNGSCKLKNSKAGVTAMVRMKEITQSCFAMELQESAKHLSGNENHVQRRVESELVLTSYDASSLSSP